MGRHSSTNHSPSSRRHRNSHSRHNPDASPPPPPPREKQHRSSKPVWEGSGSPAPRSPSPRTKRLKGTQSDREQRERNHGRGRGSEGIERKEKRGSGRDDANDDDHNDGSRKRHHNGRSRHRSQSPQQHVAANSKPRDEVTNSRGAEHRNYDIEENDSVEKMKAAEEALEEKQKQKPSFELSGKLAAETNRVRGVTLLFNEPPEARKPDIKWRLYVFKAGEVLNEPLYIHRQSCYLFGRERRVADIPTDHPSCSKQHAVIQFRQVEIEQPDGTLSKKVRPYIMDLGSTNKTFVNDSPIEPQRYYELREKDTIKFGNSSREYVLLHENSIS